MKKHGPSATPAPPHGPARHTSAHDIVLLSTADWDNPFWTNKQHVAVELARLGHRILYVESLGLRRPSASAADATRILRRLRRGLAAPRRVRERIHVWSPLVVPRQDLSLARALNRALLTRGLRARMRALGMTRPTLWTYNPMTAALVRLDGFLRIVYHCVDDIAAQPGMPAAQIQEAERHLARASDVIFTTAPALAERLRPLQPHTYDLPNVADVRHFARARDDATPIPPNLADIPRPRLGFVGALSGYKVDLDLLATLAQERPDWSVVLVGKVGEGDPGTDVSALRALPNVHLVGPRAYQELPSVLKAFDVGLLPSRLNDYTRSMFPMKFFEYLAAGLPVVATELPALASFADVAALRSDPASFMDAIEDALAGRAAPLEARLQRAREHTYESRTRRMLEILDTLPTRTAGT